jgi:tRNA(fMet)-specific endonuclease VapC
MSYVLDTNAWVYAHKNIGRYRERVSQCGPHQLWLAAPVLHELTVGVLKAGSPLRLSNFVAQVQRSAGFLAFDEAAAQASAAACVHLESQGTPIGKYDLLIAGIALANKLTLVTRNIREFERVPGLVVVDWMD